MKQVLIVATLFTLFGCSPILEMSTPRAVLLSNVDTFNSTKAFKLAETECMKHNRHAIEIPDNIRDGKVSYECKE